MSRAVKILMAVLIVVATFLATSTGFFYAKSNSLEKKYNDSQKKTDVPVSEASSVVDATTATTTPASVADTTTIVSTTSTDSRPSSPADTVIVGTGETLFAIGQKVGVSYTLIAEANGIDANKIKVGQTLMVPKNNQISFVASKDKATALQKDVDNGQYGFRLKALDTAKADSPTAYGLLSTDNFVLDKTDAEAGSATVSVVRGDKTYSITLTQPATKGDKGIWAIESIKPQTK